MTDFTWTNGLGTNVWEANGNWNAAGWPDDITDTAIFDGTSSNTNCNTTGNLTIFKISSTASYTATITLGGNLATTDSPFSINLVAGKLDTSTSNYSLTTTGNLTCRNLTGNASAITCRGLAVTVGTYSATSGVTTVGNSGFSVSGTFIHNNGTINFNNTNTTNFIPQWQDVYNVTLSGSGYVILQKVTNILGDLTINGTGPNAVFYPYYDSVTVLGITTINNAGLYLDNSNLTLNELAGTGLLDVKNNVLTFNKLTSTNLTIKVEPEGYVINSGQNARKPLTLPYMKPMKLPMLNIPCKWVSGT